MSFFRKLFTFIRDVAEDERIPKRDKKIVLALLALIVSPIDLIPDWIPVFGLLDDIIYLALVLDYFFNLLDQEILLSHYPWGMKSYAAVRRSARLISFFTPEFLKNKLWKYEGSPYKRK
jgi:uncharacterized membrane protein YkvA (DUF1232 family)